MKILIYRLLVSMWIGFAYTSAFAQKELSLSLETAKTYAMEYNRSLQKAGITIKEAQSALWEATAAGLPQAKLDVDYTNSLGFKMEIQISEAMPPQAITMPPTSNAVFTVSQLVFSGQYWIGRNLAKLGVKISEESEFKIELAVKENVSIAFFNILVAEEGSKILKKNILNVKDIQKQTSDMARVGIVEQTDADQLDIQVLNTEVALHELERNVELAYNVLRLQLGVGADVKITLTDNLYDLANSVNISKLNETQFVLNDNIDYRLLKTQEELQKQQIKMEKAAFLPTVSAFYSYTEKIKKGNFDMRPPNTLGVMVSVPIFSSFQRVSKVRQARFKLDGLQTDIDQMVDQVNIQAKQLLFNVQNAFERYELQLRNVEVANKVFNSSALKHKQGLLSGLDLTTANNNYLQAENSLLTATSDLLSAQVKFYALIGTL